MCDACDASCVGVTPTQRSWVVESMERPSVEPTVKLTDSWGSAGGVALGGCAASMGSCGGAKAILVSLHSSAWNESPTEVSRVRVVVSIGESGIGVDVGESGCWATGTV